MTARMRITHESLLRLIAASSEETNAPSARWLHAESWSLHPASAEAIASGKANWKLVWRTPDEVEARRRRTIEGSANGLAAVYDIIW